MKTIKLFAFFLTLSITANAQQSFFETIKAHGPDATYQVYGDLYKNDKGEPAAQEVTSYKNVIEKHTQQGVLSGITVNKVLDDGKIALEQNYNGSNISAIKQVGFPNTSILHHTGYNRGYVAFDNYIFFLHGISDDQTNFSEIRSFMILDGSASAADTKKKKKGKFWKQLKEATLNQRPSGEGSSAEYADLMAKDPEKLVRDYLKKMKAKQASYTMTSQDRKNHDILINGAKEYDALVKSKNDAYWKSEEGQAILRNRRLANGASQANNVTLRNTSGSTVFVGTNGSNNRGTEISPGSSASWSCSQDAYIQQVTKVSNTRSFKSTSTRVYRANSGCGNTVSIN